MVEARDHEVRDAHALQPREDLHHAGLVPLGQGDEDLSHLALAKDALEVSKGPEDAGALDEVADLLVALPHEAHEVEAQRRHEQELALQRLSGGPGPDHQDVPIADPAPVQLLDDLEADEATEQRPQVDEPEREE